jgi:hypothetical protein
MAYGHAERTLATIRLLAAETEHLLLAQPELDAEQQQWLRDAGSQRAAPTNRGELRKSA